MRYLQQYTTVQRVLETNKLETTAINSPRNPANVFKYELKTLTLNTALI